MRLAGFAAIAAIVAAASAHPQAVRAQGTAGGDSAEMESGAPENPMAALGDPVSQADLDKFEKARSGAPAITGPAPKKFRSAPPALTVDSFKRVTRSAAGDTSEAAPAPGTREALDKLLGGAGSMDRSRMQRRQPSAGDSEVGERGARANRTIIGTDDRVQVTQTSQYPFTTLGFVYAEFDDNTAGGCSGTMIAPNLVLTAAHCVYRTETSQWATFVAFVPGRNGREAPLGKFEAQQWTITQGYLDQSGKEYGYDHLFHDIAVLELKQPAGQVTGWLPVGYNDKLAGFYGNIIGYPGDKPDGTLWSVSCPIDPNFIAPSLFEMECDTYEGTSGSSIYAYYKNDDKRVVYGVNIAGTDQANYGLRITGPYFEYLQAFLNK